MTDLCVVGLGFGDEGKGTIIDYLARQNPDATVVRFNGGAQAAHNVITPEGLHHTFAQFGSGTFAGCRTHLSRHMLINPMNLLNEARVLAVNGRQWDALDRLTIDPAALITTRLHMAWNRIEEISRRYTAHGSCGQGIGATVEYALSHGSSPLRAGHLRDPERTRLGLQRLRDYYLVRRLPKMLLTAASEEAFETLEYERDILWNLDLDLVAEEYGFWSKIIQYKLDDELEGDLIFEGAQGVGLDEKCGTAPHNTWTNCTPKNAQDLLRGLERPRATVIGVTRTYQTRHGAGPLPTETSSIERPELHNTTGTYQGAWRVGHLDCGLLKFTAAACGGVNQIALTHMDMVEDRNVVGYEYSPSLSAFGSSDLSNLGYYAPRYQTWHREDFADRLEHELKVPVSILSYGPTADDKVERCASMA